MSTDDDSPESASVTIDRGEISDGCFVNFDVPSPNGMLISTHKDSRASSHGMSDILDIKPSVDAATIFVKPFTLTF